jgi:SAM-dependent methyltransferase
VSVLPLSGPRARYRAAYAKLRQDEGRGAGGARELFELPYLKTGPLAPQWRIRRRTFDRFLSTVLVPLERRARRPLRILDLGAGNGWLSGRMALRGHFSVAVDFRCDGVDGLAAGVAYAHRLPRMFARVAASFEELPLSGRVFDVALFNASLHYAERLARALGEAVRGVAPGGRVVVLDSPFYRRAASGEAMVDEKRRATRERFADLAEDLLAMDCIEYLTRARLQEAARPLSLTFRRHRVLYPFGYEWRGVKARLTGAREPSRFDLWEARVA